MNYKIEVKNKEQADEAESLAQTLGYKMDTMFSEEWSKKYCYLLLCSDMSAGFGCELMTNGDEPMSLTELRAIVSLHKNPINMDKVLSGVRSEALGLLKDKEYLNKETHIYVKTNNLVSKDSNWIEIPEGAKKATKLGAEIVFWNGDDSFAFNLDNKWSSAPDSMSFNTYVESYGGVEIIWQRHTQPEELPFVDDEPIKRMKAQDEAVSITKSELEKFGFSVSINDQYAEIEQVRKASITDTLNERQSTYGDFSMVAEMTQGLLFVMSQYGYNDMPDTHKESIHMIASKLARIINGNHDHKDSWHDIAGYATLVERSL